MVTGLPSSGIEMEVFSVRRERSVARSVPVRLPPEVWRVDDSVGAGNGGLTPIALANRFWESRDSQEPKICDFQEHVFWGAEGRNVMINKYWLGSYRDRPGTGREGAEVESDNEHGCRPDSVELPNLQ